MHPRVRVIPCLLLDDGSLIKTVRFRTRSYIGDPANTVRIFNELEVDELCVLDISATTHNRGPDFGLLAELASEAFMPLCYGGGVQSVDTVGRLLRIGFEKVAINSAAVTHPEIVSAASKAFGSQAIVASIDARKRLFGGYEVMTHGGTRRTGVDPAEWAVALERRGAGEILLTSIDREGTWRGFDLELVRSVTGRVSVPVIAHGGAGSVDDIRQVVRAGASAVALGSMVVYQGKDLGVLVNFPDRADLEKALLRASHE
jgi:cyclase